LTQVQTAVSRLRLVLYILNEQPEIERTLSLLERDAIGDYLELSDQILGIVSETTDKLRRP
jgi:hypothetical protein